jgi:hypothetical protein
MVARSGSVEVGHCAWVRGGQRLPSHVKENVMRAVLMLVITWMILSPEEEDFSSEWR